ncbi:MAG: hypothetical protein A2315_17590 [Ignavibacteria bacterium RIFOXYB2_FULL_35_12]|nr:MAG: hypothetical protein A2058_03655 [Ignavibacteria bacterium GWA2_36_19]OGU59557.1 MAG: hypothetical protein A2X60_07155 [Ignavibacteria bacterium GWF2_35_20]OGU78091.1 MAG: hypothetical protein A2254_13775 [Ignavibacteria bacterium RIFOXYA2_FULL_35_9]OGU87232.1 MAG: hypothetical protein A3K31_13440 [Ignavibacteria bacterium RIFOXYA12_FULL_35_25]OGU90367.1 MAG: hypothetical protein A2492_06600 [Ignavibacteria bacterium RIFOXYC12_FULL_35_11]OGU97656.1 MAG: hypothetical protein A2347_16935
MIISLIFFIHLIFSLVIFTTKWQEEKLSAAFLNIGLIAVLFTVGWSIASIIAKAVMEPKGLGIHFDRDTFALTLLTIGEYLFYRLYYKPIHTIEGDTGKQ